jgi:hypothetical protein
MLHAQNFSYIHILYTQKGVYIIFEYKKNFEREAYNKRTTQYGFCITGYMIKIRSNP